MSETTFWFGMHEGKEVSEVSSGYLRWMVNKMDPAPLPKYQYHDDGTPMTVEEVKALTERYRNIIDAASDELAERGEE